MQPLTFRTALFRSSLFAILFAFASGCASLDQPPEAELRRKKASKQRIFFAPVDTVWTVAHKVLKYSIATENQDSGIIETEYVKAVDGWLPPNVKKPPSAGIRYKIVMILAKGKTDGREATRVTIEKRIEMLQDFFSEPDVLESDGLEEAAIFYRIERELIIEEALRKAG